MIGGGEGSAIFELILNRALKKLLMRKKLSTSHFDRPFVFYFVLKVSKNVCYYSNADAFKHESKRSFLLFLTFNVISHVSKVNA